jgi:hypothetical protein
VKRMTTKRGDTGSSVTRVQMMLAMVGMSE